MLHNDSDNDNDRAKDNDNDIQLRQTIECVMNPLKTIIDNTEKHTHTHTKRKKSEQNA